MRLRIYIKSLYTDEYYALDVAQSTSFSLVNTNALFDFENLRYMRSTSFTVPRTARNERMLLLAGNSHTTNSDYARAKIKCRVWIDEVEKEGYMTITSATKTEYNCTLLIGEYVANDVLAKTTKEVLREQDYTGRLIYGRRSDVLAANSAAATAQFIAPIAYYSGKEGYAPDIIGSRPSVYAKMLLDRCISNSLTDIQCRIVVQPTTENAVSGQFELQFDSSGLVSFSGNDADKGSEYFDRVYHGSNTYMTNVSVNEAQPETRKELQFFRAKQDVILKTGGDTANPILVYTDEFYILSYATEGSEETVKHITGATFALPTFISTAKLKWNGSASTLGGFEVTGEVTDTLIPAGTEFRCVQASDVYPLKSDVAQGGNIYQLSTIGGRSGLLTFYAEPDTDVIIAREWDCIPDIKIADLLRSYAKMSGQLFYISGNSIVGFSGYTDDAYELRSVIECTTIERRFSDFAQETSVVYADGKDNPALIATYSVASEYLTESKEMAMAWSAGKQLAAGDERMYVTDLGNSKWLGKVGQAVTMTRTSPIANIAVKKLCTASTMVKVKALMPFVVFDSLLYYRHVRYDSALWTWIEGTWQDGVAEMTLQLDEIY